MYRKFLPILLVLALSLMACRLTVDVPISQKTGPTVTDQISVPLPAGEAETRLSLEFGAGTLNLRPGGRALVSGTATYNVADFKPEVSVDGSSVRISQGDWRVRGIPQFSNIENEWDLALGSTPIDLKIEAGAYKAEYEFGGLALTNLTVRDGAADVQLNFSEPNAAEMTLLRYETGASNVTLTGLANANFAAMDFDGGAGNFSLDFSGELKRNASIHIEVGLSNLTLVLPAGIPVQVIVQGGLSNVSAGTGWAVNDNNYTQAGEGPALTITVEMGAGNLTLTR